MQVYQPGLGVETSPGSGPQERAGFLAKPVHALREDLWAFANTESSGQASTERQLTISILSIKPLFVCFLTEHFCWGFMYKKPSGYCWQLTVFLWVQGPLVSCLKCWGDEPGFWMTRCSWDISSPSPFTLITFKSFMRQAWFIRVMVIECLQDPENSL